MLLNSRNSTPLCHVYYLLSVNRYGREPGLRNARARARAYVTLTVYLSIFEIVRSEPCYPTRHSCQISRRGTRRVRSQIISVERFASLPSIILFLLLLDAFASGSLLKPSLSLSSSPPQPAPADFRGSRYSFAYATVRAALYTISLIPSRSSALVLHPFSGNLSPSPPPQSMRE